MKQLQHFHLYALKDIEFSDKLILSKFKNEFWLNHNWSFAICGYYLFLLPFYFDYFYDFSNDIQSNNSELVRTHSRLWYKIK
jgi:hypothetical protein